MVRKLKLFTNVDFLDAQQLGREHPNTFAAPTEEDIAQIKVGDYVKVCDGEERFWNIIKKMDGDIIVAEINNKLVCGQDYNLGDLIQFSKHHIYDIESADQETDK